MNTYIYTYDRSIYTHTLTQVQKAFVHKIRQRAPLHSGIPFATPEGVRSRYNYNSRLHFDVRDMQQIFEMDCKRSVFASHSYTWALAACLPRKDDVCITTELFVRFHTSKFDKRLCKMNSTENLRSFGQYHTLPPSTNCTTYCCSMCCNLRLSP